MTTPLKKCRVCRILNYKECPDCSPLSDEKSSLQEKLIEQKLKEYEVFYETPTEKDEDDPHNNIPVMQKWIRTALSESLRLQLEEVERLITKEIVLAHTTTIGKTSRLTSLAMKIKQLKDSYV